MGVRTIEYKTHRIRMNAKNERRSERLLALWEIVSIVVSVLIAEWFVLALAGNDRRFILIPAILALAYIFASMLMRGESLRELGFRLDNFWRASKLLLPPTLIAALLMIATGWFFGATDFVRWKSGRSALAIPFLGVGWGFIQQFALQCFINRRAQIVFGPGLKSVLLVAAVFGLLHFPNPVLTIATFLGGLIWAWVYQREPNIWVLALSHSLMTWLLVSTIPQFLLNSLRVGYKFFGLFI